MIQLIHNRRNKLNKDGKASIELEIYVNRTNRKFRSSKIQIEPKYWDEKKQEIKNTHPKAEVLNLRLQIMVKKYEEFLLKQKINNRKLDISILENRTTHSTSLYNHFQNVIDHANIDLSKGTNRIYKRCLKYLKEFSIDIHIEDLTVEFMQRFNTYLTNEKNLAQNTRAVLFSKFKKVLGEAVKNDFLSFKDNPFNRGFSIREVEVEIKSLSLDELKQIENTSLELRPELVKTKDMFLFSCYTSMRFGDLSTLTKDNFEFLDNGKIRLSYIPQKTRHYNNKKVSWIITDFWGGKIDEIVKKYIDVDGCFFDYSNPFYNRQLKELQRYAGIKQSLHSHLARHTCITLLINDFGLDITKAQLIAGHSKITQTRRYLRITERDLEDAAKKINWDV